MMIVIGIVGIIVGCVMMVAGYGGRADINRQFRAYASDRPDLAARLGLDAIGVMRNGRLITGQETYDNATARIRMGGVITGVFVVTMIIGIRIPSRKICPYCKEKIAHNATICKHCHKNLCEIQDGIANQQQKESIHSTGQRENIETPVKKVAVAKQMVRAECPNCGNKFLMPSDVSATTCPHCRIALEMG